MPDDVRWVAGIVARGAVHCVGDETVKALAKRVLELEQHKEALSQSLDQMVALADEASNERNQQRARVLELEAVLDACRAVGVDVTPREDDHGWAVNNTRALNAEEHAEMVRQTEREACAALAEDFGWEPIGNTKQRAGLVEYTAKRIAEAIRARGGR